MSATNFVRQIGDSYQKDKKKLQHKNRLNAEKKYLCQKMQKCIY
jgi:hypothetical protein